MSSIERDANLFVEYRGEDRHDFPTGKLIWDREQPGVVRLLGPFEPVTLTLEAATVGLFERCDEPSGTATVWPARCHTDRDWWLVITGDVQVTVYARTVGAFLADVTWYACLNGVRLPVRKWETEQPVFRTDGGAS